eukprot:4624981-Amphidinium_carterae.1
MSSCLACALSTNPSRQAQTVFGDIPASRLFYVCLIGDAMKMGHLQLSAQTTDSKSLPPK